MQAISIFDHIYPIILSWYPSTLLNPFFFPTNLLLTPLFNVTPYEFNRATCMSMNGRLFTGAWPLPTDFITGENDSTALATINHWSMFLTSWAEAVKRAVVLLRPWEEAVPVSDQLSTGLTEQLTFAPWCPSRAHVSELCLCSRMHPTAWDTWYLVFLASWILKLRLMT